MSDPEEDVPQLTPKQEKEVKSKLVQLIKKSREFHKEVANFPTVENRIENLYKRERSLKRARYLVHCGLFLFLFLFFLFFSFSSFLMSFLFLSAEQTRILIHADVFEFMGEFIKHKQKHGSDMEKVVYEEMTPKKLVSIFSFSLFPSLLPFKLPHSLLGHPPHFKTSPLLLWSPRSLSPSRSNYPSFCRLASVGEARDTRRR